jgi:hypothetical protein
MTKGRASALRAVAYVNRGERIWTFDLLPEYRTASNDDSLTRKLHKKLHKSLFCRWEKI